VVNELKLVLNILVTVHDKRHHNQSQGTVERGNKDTQNMITTRMQTENTTDWSQGLRFV
jgi:hypothetical protein